MGTISDKLMRVINTKEDIRKALISKGYDVPTSIPFKEYAKMISDLPCKVDDFPKLPGDVTRWHFGGLTNEMMAAMDDPRIEDADHKGRFLSFKNFAWGGMSGVGGYTENYNSNKWRKVESRIDATWTYKSFNARSIKDNRSAQLFYQSSPSDTGFRVLSCTIKVSGLTDGQGIEYVSNGTQQFVIMRIENDGIYHLPSFDFGAKNGYYGFKFLKLQESCNITIEQLPLYPGFILGDGVDDLAVTEKELNFEDTYTVYTAFIPFQNNPTRNMILCGADSEKTFSMQYSSLVYVSFIAGNNYYINADFVNGLNLFACKRNGNNICIKNLLTNKVVTGTCGDWVENAGLYYLWKNATYASFARAGIAGQIIDNGHFTTDEEDENILNWHKKQYPWLFPDQAWTVTGKTNEDEDRATIANITGNGNDLVLSNFGFAEGSGYGLYAYNFNSFELRDNVVKPTDVKKDSFRIIGIGDNGNVLVLSNTSNSAAWKIRITGMKEGDSCIVGNANKSGDYVKITKDGVYTFQKQYAATSINGIWYNSSQEVDVLVEQIPDYEGYLVTDGVDDEVRSAAFTLNEDWTIVGNWEFITNENKNAGLTKVYSFYLYNRDYGIFVYEYLNAGQGFSVEDVKSLKAICSDGRIYLNDWQEIRNNIEQEATISKGVMAIGYFNRDFTKMAFKNLGIYNNQLLSKDDCIKAYNYLQTLKSK